MAGDIVSLVGSYDRAVLVSGDEDFIYAVNAVAYKACRIEIAGFRSNTAPKLIDVADCFIDLGEIADRVRKEFPHGLKYEERELHVSQQPPPPASFIEEAPIISSAPPSAGPEAHVYHPPIGSTIEANANEGLDEFAPGSDFIRVTDDQ